MSNTFKAALWMSGAIFAFSLMAIAGRQISSSLDTFEIMLFRSLIGMVIVVGVLAAMGQLSDAPATAHFPRHVARNTAHFAGQNLWFYAVGIAPLAQVFALEFTTPIWLLALSALFLGERLTVSRVVWAAVGFAGILLITRPTTTLAPGLAPALMSAVCFATTAMFTKALTRTESLGTILFWLTTLQALFGFVCAGYDFNIALPSAANAPWVLAIGIGGLLAHFSITKALSLAPATVVMPVDFARLPVIALLGMVLYGEELETEVIIGGALILLANAANLYTQHQQDK